ncbi:MAG: substrate-binding domain-containing protein [Planctomycetaceae bacterium]|nr:substrate-binding domain-containing protein [Planctomycetaceae bacterium]
MRKLGLLLLVTAVACVLTARPVSAQSALDPSLPPYRAEEQLSGKLTLSGSYTISQVASVWAESFRQFHPDVQIDVQVKGAVESVNAVTSGDAQIGLLSRSILQSEAAAFQQKHGHPPVLLTPMFESIAIFVNKDNPVKGLTIKDLDAIFSFTLKRGAAKPAATWADVGATGPLASQAIAVCGRRQATGVQVFFQEVVLGGGEFRPDMKEILDNVEMLKAIAENPNAIGFAGATYRDPGTRMVPLAVQAGQPFVALDSVEATRGQYPLIRPLQLVINQTPGEPLPELQAEFIKYVFSRFGQEDVVRSGMHPIGARPADLALDAVGLGAIK